MILRPSFHAGAFVGTLLLLVLLPYLGGCEKPAQAVTAQPTVVTVSQPIQQQVSDFAEFTGNTAPLAHVDVRARVKGFLKKVNFVDGANVKEGDVLFEIEPDVFQAEVSSAEAKLQAANASSEKADADLKIKQEMAAGNAASKLDVIQAQANVDVAKANIALCNAQLIQAKIDLGYATIKAPMSGRIDQSRVDVGNLVGSDGNTLLAIIVQADPIYVYFDVDEAAVQRFQKRMIEKGVTPGAQAPNLPFVMALGATADFAYKGTIDFVDNKVDPSTGTIKVRGILENKTRAIAPGFFSRVQVPDGEAYPAVLVPERAIGVDQGQKYVLAVNDKNLVEMRPIETGSQQGKMRVVKQGLKPDEWIITEGLLRTRPGATVSPEKKPISAVETGKAGGSPSTAPSTQPQA